jgi:hypothetical protein
MKKAAKIINSKRHGITKAHIKRAVREHHYLGELIGSAARGLGMAAPYLGTALHGLGGLGALAQTGLGLSQMRQANRAAAAQERLMKAQARSAENQNAYFEKQMAGSQPHKKGGRAKSYRRNFR